MHKVHVVKTEEEEVGKRYSSLPPIREHDKTLKRKRNVVRRSTKWTLLATSVQTVVSLTNHSTKIDQILTKQNMLARKRENIASSRCTQSTRQSNAMFTQKSRWLQYQASFSAGITHKLIMDSQREASKILDRTIARMARVQEEKERRRLMKEQGEAVEDEKKRKKEEDYERSSIVRKVSVFGSYRKQQIKTLPNVEQPIERFRKIVQLLSFLLKMKTSMDRKYRSQQTSVVFAELDEQTMTGVDCDGVVFDPRNFKAVKEVQLSQEATHILSLSPGSRSPEQLQMALVALKTSVAAFGEYPLKMQKKLVSVGWFERFEAKRVIIRQGHRAENFYFILSGTAIVTLLINDSSTGEQRNTTIAVLGKGSSFGELALLHHKTRSATVVCKDEVSLLAVCREDFRDIFMGYEDGKEPEHIRFLKSVPFFKDLPVEDLSTKHDLCIFHYFRRGVVIVNESKTDWIYVVKTGSCRVLTHLSKKTAKLKRSSGKQTKSKEFLPVIPINELERRRALYTAAGDRIRTDMWSPEGKRPRTEPLLSLEKKRDLTLPVLVDEQDKFKKTAKNVTCIARMNMIHQEVKARETHREQIENIHRKISTMDKCSNERNKTCLSESDLKGEQVVVQIELLKPKDQFGLSVLLFDCPAVKCHLVSNGAECVLIKKSWFLQYANEATLRKLRNQIPPYPSQDTLEQKMQDQADWDSYKTQTMNNLLNTLHI